MCSSVQINKSSIVELLVVDGNLNLMPSKEKERVLLLLFGGIFWYSSPSSGGTKFLQVIMWIYLIVPENH